MVAVAIVLVVAAYVAGTFPTARLVATRRGHNPHVEGSGNPGATNVYRVAGRRAGLLVGLGDVAKGAAPTALGLAASGRPLAAACWIATVVGHVFPLQRGLRGGKGVATAGGGALVMYPLASAVLVIVFVAVAKVTRRASLASLSIAVLLPLFVALTGRAGWEVGVAAGIGALVVARHAGNIGRLLRHEEHAYRSG